MRKYILGCIAVLQLPVNLDFDALKLSNRSFPLTFATSALLFSSLFIPNKTFLSPSEDILLSSLYFWVVDGDNKCSFLLGLTICRPAQHRTSCQRLWPSTSIFSVWVQILTQKNYGPLLVIEPVLKNTIVGVEVFRFTLKSSYEWYLLHIRYT